MPDLPEAKIQIDEEAGALASGTDVLTVLAAVSRNADMVPRVFSSTKALLAQHDFAEGIDYCALHFDETRKPIIFVGLPIATAGTIGRIDTSGNTGSSAVSVSAGSSGVLDKADGIITVAVGGVVGTDQIQLDVSMDGGNTTKRVRVGTATSYTVPYLGFIVSLGAGSLVAGDVVLRFSAKAPRWDAAGLTAARTALAGQSKQSRSWMVIGDLETDTDALDVVTEINAYATTVDRCSLARTQARDRLPLGTLSRTTVRMSGAPNVTFAEVGGTGDTITRSAGSFITDGFVAGMAVTVAGSVSNNFANQKITAVSATVLTLDTQDLIAEGPVAGVTITGSVGITFAEVGATGDTITRSGGSWLDDGFADGDRITITGSVSNNITDALITDAAALVLTLNTQDLTPEFIGAAALTLSGGETDADWVAAIDEEFEDVRGEPRIDIAAGTGFKKSPITQWRQARPAAWAASLREYGPRDVQVATYRKDLGALSGWTLENADGERVLHDERADGGLLLAGFTCLRTYANSGGVYIALSLTRAEEGSLLSRTHNMHVANIACNVAQAETENAIGITLELQANGTATPAALKLIEERVNTALAIALLQRRSDGPRASDASWEANANDVLNVPGAELTGTLDLRLGGTIEKINTRVRVQTAG